MVSLGIVGLDSSHPESFAGRLEETGLADLDAVWDGGDVRDDAYVDAFCERHDATCYDDVDAMAAAVDGVMVLTVDWDTHLPLSRPFFEAGVAVLIDKPIAGRLADVEAIEELARGGRLFGGSMHPYSPTFGNWPLGVPDRTLYAVGSNHPFYYGIHVVDPVSHLVGEEWTAVTPDPAVEKRVEIAFENRAHATVQLGAPVERSTSVFLDVSDRTRIARVGDDQSRHRETEDRYLRRFVELVEGTPEDREGSGTIQRRLFDGATLHLAVHAALEAGECVEPDDESLRAFHKDGSAFVEEYAREASN